MKRTVTLVCEVETSDGTTRIEHEITVQPKADANAVAGQLAESLRACVLEFAAKQAKGKS